MKPLLLAVSGYAIAAAGFIVMDAVYLTLVSRALD